MSSVDAGRKGVIYTIIRYLQQEAQTSQLHDSEKESVDVATECLADAYQIALHDPAQCAGLALDEEAFVAEITRTGVFDAPGAVVGCSDDASGTAQAAEPEGEGEAEAAREEAEKRKAAAKAQADVHKQRGNRHIKDHEYALAVEEYTKAIAICPDNAVYYGNRAAAFSSLESVDEVIKDCQRSMQIDPKYVKAHSRMGNAYLAKQEYGLAADSYSKALAIDPANQTYAEQLAFAERKMEEEAAAAAGREEGVGEGAVGGEHEAENEADGAASMLDLGQMDMENMPNLSQVNISEVMSSVINSPDMLRYAQGVLSNPSMMSMAQNMFGKMNGSSIQDMVSSLSAQAPETPQSPPRRNK